MHQPLYRFLLVLFVLPCLLAFPDTIFFAFYEVPRLPLPAHKLRMFCLFLGMAAALAAVFGLWHNRLWPIWALSVGALLVFAAFAPTSFAQGVVTAICHLALLGVTAIHRFLLSRRSTPSPNAAKVA